MAEKEEVPSERLFVTKIPRDANENDLRDYFSQFGDVEKPDPGVKLEAKWASKFQQNHRFRP